MSIKNKKYRVELDGLRAIAVMAVIIYHAELSWRGMTVLPGGFLGVDIFFVLSGFLITGILIERSPNLLSFYKSRLDRIYPALLLLLFFSCIASYQFLQPNDLLAFTESLKGALGFYSNYVFMYEDSYASDASKYKALLHTWSLGVEWQYYIIFPLVIYFLKKYFFGNFEKVVIFLFAASFFYGLYLAQINGSHAFYSTFARVWQLFAGGLVFLISKSRKENKFDAYFSALGLAIIACLLLFFKDTDSNLIYISFFAVLGAALFIIFTSHGTLVYKLTTLRPAVFLGAISYSLYLYHQPILVFYRLRYSDINAKSFILLLIVMVFAAYFSYRFFENPMRRSKQKIKYLVILSLVILIYTFINGVKNTGGFPNRQSKEIKAALNHFQIPEYRRLNSSNLGRMFNGQEIESCNMRVPETACNIGSSKNHLLAVGDSFVGVFTYMLADKMKDFSLTSYQYEQCPLLSDPIWFGNVPACWEINKKRWSEIKLMPQSTILLGVNYYQFYGGKKSIENFIEGGQNSSEKVEAEDVYKSFRRSVENLIALGHKPVVLLQPPSVNQDVNKEMKRKIISNVNIKYFEEEFLGVPTVDLDQNVRNSLSGLQGVFYMDLNKKLCRNNKCMTFGVKGGLYNEGGHLSYFGAELFYDDIVYFIKTK